MSNKSGLWTQGVPSPQLCHIDMECFWGKDEDLTHPYKSRSLHQSVNSEGLKTNMHRFYPHTAMTSTAGWGKTERSSEWGLYLLLTLSWQATHYQKGANRGAPWLWNRNCWLWEMKRISLKTQTNAEFRWRTGATQQILSCPSQKKLQGNLCPKQKKA